jgi:integrase
MGGASMGRPPSQPFSDCLSGPSQLLLGHIKDRHERNHLRGFFGYCASEDIAFHDVSDAELEAYGRELKNRHVKRVNQAIRNVALTWNKLADRFPWWPQNRLIPPDRTGKRSLPFSAFPPSFEKDFHSYVSSHRGLDLFDSSRAKALAPATCVDRRRKILQLATMLVESGRAPETIRQLADLVGEDALETMLRDLWNSVHRKRNGHAANFARLLKGIAKHYVKSPDAIVDRIRQAESNLRPAKTGMTDRNMARLRVLVAEPNLLRLIKLPQSFIKSLDTLHPTVFDAVRVQLALAVAILLSAPMREKNLANLQAYHIDRIGEHDCYIVIPGHEVKNEQALHYKLPRSVIQLFDLYLKIYRPLLLKGTNTTALFVSLNGKQKQPHHLGAQIPKFVQEQTKLVLNVHLFRHLAGYIFLKAHPGEYEPVRQLLGHKSIRTTTQFYTGLETADAFRRFDEILDKLRTEGGS